MINPTNQRPPIWFDIETGGIDASQSSILSIAFGQGTDIRSVYAAPQVGTFLSAFSEQHIIPQLHGKTLLSEKQSIEAFIQQLEASPHAPIAGFNITGFDIGFIQRRARIYGLEKRFRQAIQGRRIIDPVRQVKDIVASAISRHADIGTFSAALQGKTWAAAEATWDALPFEKRPIEYNLIAQIKGYLKADRDRAMFKGWKLEDLYKLLPEEQGLSGRAHEAITDIAMTQRLVRAVETGELERELQKPARALQWMEIVKARGYHQFGAGRILSWHDIVALNLTIRPWIKSRVIAPLIGVSLAAVIAANLISGRDDQYNTIEGLPHRGFAQSGRLQLTDFGSGYRVGDMFQSFIEWASQRPTATIRVLNALGIAIGAASLGLKIWLLNKIFGSDDEYNTVEGFSHKGLASELRRANTDFGSGYRGIIKVGRELTSSNLGKSIEQWLNIIPAKDDWYNIIEGLPHRGLAGLIRLWLTEFGSGWKGGRQIFRAERLYKSAIKLLLREQGYTGKISWLSYTDETGELNLVARSEQGEALFGISRTLREGSVDLTSIDINERFRGGLGRKFYEIESRILRRLGFEGATVSSPISNPITGRLQAELYGSRPMPLFYQDIERIYGVGPEEFQEMLMAKKMTEQEWKAVGFAPTFVGRIPPRNSANNSMDGLGHSGLASRLRRLLTPFGSRWNALRNLVQGTETFNEMIASKGFQKALSKAKRVRKIAAGSFGITYEMKGVFRGQEFSFVRKFSTKKHGDLTDMFQREAEMTAEFSESFAPDVYRVKLQRGGRSVIDMELFEGSTFGELSKKVVATGDESLLPTHEDYAKVGAAVTAMHAKGIAHMDLHAGNVMKTPSGEIGIIDFGFAGKPGTSIYDVLPQNMVLKDVRGQPIDNRSFIHDIEMLEENMKEVRGTANIDYLNYTAPSLPKTSVQRKRAGQAHLQRAASATAWSAGKSGSRRSKL